MGDVEKTNVAHVLANELIKDTTDALAAQSELIEEITERLDEIENRLGGVEAKPRYSATYIPGV